MIKMYDWRPDGVYLPIRYYTHPNKTSIVLVASIHEGEKDFYDHIIRTFKTCDVVIYEELRPRDADTMKDLDKSWSRALYDDNLDEAFLGAIFLPTPQTFMHDHGLQEEAYSFDYSQGNWISGDGNWHTEKNHVSLTAETWETIRHKITFLDEELKLKKVIAARKFVEKVNTHTASMIDFLNFENLYEDEIQYAIFQSDLVDPRDEMVFDVLDHLVRAIPPSRIGINFGIGDIPLMVLMLKDLCFICRSGRWLR
ncbi:MAG: hypothetical protein AAB972_01085, partial [Patescibacteria group bacterium]